MSDDATRQSIIDDEHLKLLSLGYMISAAMTAFSSLIGVWFAVVGTVMGLAISHLPQTNARAASPPPPFLGWIFAGVGLLIFAFALALAGAKLQAASWIKRRKSRTFCMVVAALTCLGIPYGTALGVLTFMVLGRDSVARQFN